MIYKVHQNPITTGSNSTLNYISNEKKQDPKSNLNYLENDKNQEQNEDRQLWFEGRKTTEKEAEKRINEAQKKHGHESLTIVLNPENDLKFEKSDLLKVDREFRNYISEANNSHIITHAATHTIEGDPAHNHIHIVVTSNQKTIDFLKQNFKNPSLNWKKNLFKIEEKIAHEKGVEHSQKALKRQLKRLTGKCKSGTYKRYSFISQHLNSKNGNLSLLQIGKSMDFSIEKGNLSQSGKERFMKEIRGVLNTLKKEKIAKQIDENHYNLDVGKFAQKMEKIVAHHEMKKRGMHHVIEFHKINQKLQKLNQNHQQNHTKKTKINHEKERENDEKSRERV